MRGPVATASHGSADCPRSWRTEATGKGKDQRLLRMEAWTCTCGGLSFRVPSGAPRLEHCALQISCGIFFLGKSFILSSFTHGWLTAQQMTHMHSYLMPMNLVHFLLLKISVKNQKFLERKGN
ncbi:hypothetical protein BDA96_08G112500 [Sorghum bicolor]|uniref:Uncharacterized protein n=1 Tax=Sorghum bicolor TaxID=4558 RepID=A0A921QH88_SORBI|nr:hypothetical protein BDA96_08G112500 [Sorghum bicolor]